MTRSLRQPVLSRTASAKPPRGQGSPSALAARLRRFFTSRAYLPIVMALPLALLGIYCARRAVDLALYSWYTIQLEPSAFDRAMIKTGVDGVVHVFLWSLAIGAAFMIVAGIAGLHRSRLGLSLLRKGYIVGYVLAAFWAYLVFSATGIFQAEQVPLGGMVPDDVELFKLRYSLIWPAALGAIFLGMLHANAWRRITLELYAGVTYERDPGYEDPAPGDALLEDVRTHGPDPRYRKSVYASAWTHLLIIVIIPWLLTVFSCIEPYRVPEGSGNPVQALVMKVQPKKKQKKKMVVNPNAAIIYAIPEMFELQREVEEQTMKEYEANPNRVAGKMGQGGGDEGGWPEGVGDEPIRFIRLEHRDSEWDDGMDAQARADLNFLDYLAKSTGFKVARHTEAISVRDLRRFPEGQAPPFVYITGSGSVNISSSEARILRDYLMGGGMLFADAGFGPFDRSFRSFVQNALFPGERLLTVANDDPIHQAPNSFPNGPPPLWRHGGTKPLGVKKDGRWVVYYHPGDVNDAWKTGHSGTSSQLAESAYKLGVNIVYYAFTHYLEETKQHRR